VIFLLARRAADAPPEHRPTLDLVGSVLWALGMGLTIFGVLRSSEWGWLRPAEGAPSWLGVSPVVWLILGGFLAVRLFMGHARRLEAEGREPLVTPALFRNRQMTSGLTMFFFQYTVMMGVFFVVPLYLSVALGLSAIETGIRITPLSVSLLIAAVGVPRFRPSASPRRVVTIGLIAMVAGIVLLFTTMDVEATASIVTWPMLLIGLGMGGLASQLGAVTVSAVPDEQSPEVGGLQNTASQFGASLGTALAGSILIASLTSAFLTGIAGNPDVPDEVASEATVELASGIPFVSNADLTTAMQEAGASPEVTDAVVDQNAEARIAGLRSSLALLAIIGLIALYFTRRLPDRQPTGPNQGATADP
jgi:Na+/melibiose symporter-like transporter